MFISKSKTLILTAFLSLASIATSQAQTSYRLPASHNNQHSELIANQKPLTSPAQKLIEDVRKREAADNADVFAQNWESQSVNPYGNTVVIPQRKDIDVEDFVAPVPGRVTSPYGWRARFGRMHKGVDLSLSVGDTVRSAFSGKVRLTKYEGKGYGYYVVVRHDNGMETVYGHLSRFLVKPNQRVKAGEPIALGGNTGHSTGPHLHFETRYLGLAINPEAIIDFQNQTTHREVFTFEKSSYEKAQNYAPRAKKASSVASNKKAKTTRRASAASTKKSRKSKRR